MDHSDPRLDPLLQQWSDAQEAGEPVAPEALCHDCPELVDALSRRIGVLRRFEQFTNVGGFDRTSVGQNTDRVLGTEPMPERIDEFVPLSLLGEGGMGVVYLANDTRLNRQVAIKLMRRDLAARPEARDRFVREARSMAQIDHEHIMAVLSVGEVDGIPYLVMPVLRGEPLAKRLERGPLPIGEACRIGREIALGLVAAHRRGLIHRDIKPSNIWLEEREQGEDHHQAGVEAIQGQGESTSTASEVGSKSTSSAPCRVMILDFGLARAVESSHLVTQSGVVVGTPAYMSPEQAEGSKINSRSDLFSLGTVLYEMITGRRPFPGNSAVSIFHNLVHQKPRPIREFAPLAPPALCQLVERLLAKNPGDRPTDAQVVADQLDQIGTKNPMGMPSRLRSMPRVAAWTLGMLGLAALSAFIVFRPLGEGPIDSKKGKSVVVADDSHLPVNNIVPPMTIHQFPPPDRSAISVRLDPGFTYGAICFVMDLTGPPSSDPLSPAAIMIKGLEKSLGQVPENSHVSLFAVARQDKGASFEMIQPPGPWTRGRLDDAIGKLQQLSRRAGVASSSLGHALVQAAARGFPPTSLHYKGPRFLLAVTDRPDQASGRVLDGKWPDPEAPENSERFRQFLLDQLGPRFLEVDVLCVGSKADKPADIARAEDQYKVVEKFALPGRCVVVRDATQIADEIEQSICPRLLVRDATTTPKTVPRDGLRPGERKWVEIPPGSYTAQVKQSRPVALQIEPGDLLSVILKLDVTSNKRVTYEREFLSASSVLPGVRSDLVGGRGRTLALIENSYDANANRLEPLITLEESLPEGEIRQGAPKFVWIECQPPRGGNPRHVRWFRDQSYPAPAYRILASDWPVLDNAPLTTRIKAWWTDSAEESKLLIFSTQFTLNVGQGEPRSFSRGDETAVIERVSLEDRKVAVRGAEVENPTEQERCVVIRAKHVPGKPVFLELLSPFRGAEHRYNPGTGEYTALFWGVKEIDYDALSCNLIFIEQFKLEVDHTVVTTGRVSDRKVSRPTP